MSEIRNVNLNKLVRSLSPVRKSLLRASVPDARIIRTEGGLLERLEALEKEVEHLRAQLAAPYPRMDVHPSPEIDAYTGYEYASDGTLRAYVDIISEARQVIEVAMLGAPDIDNEIDKDAYVDEENPDTNYGDYTYMRIYGESPARKRAWIYHTWGDPDVPSGIWAANPAVAFLRLYSVGTHAADVKLTLMASLAGFDETALTWNNQPDFYSDYGPIAQRLMPALEESYVYFDVTRFLWHIKGLSDTKVGNYWPSYCLHLEEVETPYTVTIASREDSDPEKRPRLLLWGRVYRSQMLSGDNRSVRFFGKPGGTYYITYRVYSRDNIPGPWAEPVVINLPSQGDAPPAPSSAPTIQATNFSNVKTIILTTETPIDFAAYEVEIKYGTTSTYLKTTSDRFEYTFASGLSGRTYQVRYRFVTRSGMTSDWSPWSSSFPINNELKIQRAEMSDGQAHIWIDSVGDIHLVHSSGSSSRTWDYVESVPLLPLLNHIRSVAAYNIDRLARAWHDSGAHSTSSTSWVTLSSYTYKPPGTEEQAWLLLLATALAFRNLDNEVQLAWFVDGSAITGGRLTTCKATQPVTVPVIGWAIADAGVNHTIELKYRSVGGQMVTIYRHACAILDLGRV